MSCSTWNDKKDMKMKNKYSVLGNLVDIYKNEIRGVEIFIEEHAIIDIVDKEDVPDVFIMPGLVDSHVHIESSMLVPSNFAELVLAQGTLGVVADPHEIANVLGEIGVDFMIDDAAKVPLEIRFSVPSCVPATDFESSGFILDSNKVSSLLARTEVVALGEVMNYNAVINSETEMLLKINAALDMGKRVDGHAPCLSGGDLNAYVEKGISTDHECSTIEEALEKISLGMSIQIREGSAAKNFDALCSLIDSHPEKVLLCTDDAHPDDISENGHINKLLKRGVKKGLNLFNLVRAASTNAVNHYGLDLGLLKKGDLADFIIVEDLMDFKLLEAFRKGERVFYDGKVRFSHSSSIILNNFSRDKINITDLQVERKGDNMRVIDVSDGELLTKLSSVNIHEQKGIFVPYVGGDILKVVVLSRYSNAKPSVAFIRGFGFEKGAIAESIAHDSHNIISVGTNDNDILNAINLLIENKGGLVATDKEESKSVKLELAGLMTNKKPCDLISEYTSLMNFTKTFNSSFESPFLSLAFMSLLVIPDIKISDKGLFDVNELEFVDLFLD